MSTRSLSPVSSHATPMEPKQSKSKSVAQRRVYGKRKANAPRAVFDQGSPARETRSQTQHVDPVESLQAKLAQVTIVDDSTHQPDNHVQPTKIEIKQQQELAEIPSDESSSSTIEDISDTPTTQSSVESSQEEAKPKSKQCETIVEVRICPKAPEQPPQITSDSPARTSESTSEDREKPSTSSNKKKAGKKEDFCTQTVVWGCS